MKRGIVVFGLVVGLLVSSVSVPLQASAAELRGSDFDPGRIIDDAVFIDKDVMSVTEIQAFLDSKVAVCDTYGAQLYPSAGQTRAEFSAARDNPAPFTCLKDYYEVPKLTPSGGVPASNYGTDTIPEGAKSAAQLIWDAAQTHDISPKVLLVTLQKEQQLVTDDWPWKHQYLYAMGASCPDTQACDQSMAGLSIQLLQSAKLFRYYLNTMEETWWPYFKPGENMIRFSPIQSCGAAPVVIANKATAALYTYSPYQPNAPALSNLYGTGDSCSTYGNRNFWRVFTEWFGTTLSTKPIVQLRVNGEAETTIDYGGQVTLRWTSAQASTCSLDGTELTATNGEGIEVLYASKSYELSCMNPNGAASALAKVVVRPVTFEYAANELAGVRDGLSQNGGRLQPVEQHLKAAEQAHLAGNTSLALKRLDLALNEVSKLAGLKVISVSDAGALSRTLTDLRAVVSRSQ